jgi:hypothetical protein
MVLFKIKRANDTIKEIETCVVKENMWNIFTKVPWRAVDLRQGWWLRKWSKLDVALIELVWVALNVWEEKYLQYAWFLLDGGAEIEDSTTRLFINRDGFIYKDVEVYKCRKIIVPPRRCSEFGCKALVLGSDDAMRRLWHLYEKYKAKKVKSV